MAFIYNEKAGVQTLCLRGEELLHIKALRLKENSIAGFRNLTDDKLYSYKLTQTARNESAFELIDAKEEQNIPNKNVNIFWCGVDPKTVE
ncbi:MAG: hypothetical protein RL154_514, partial [Pseudomonadota bacterium]